MHRLTWVLLLAVMPTALLGQRFDDLIGKTWMPVSVQRIEGEYLQHHQNYPLFTFLSNGKGKVERPASNRVEWDFDYRIKGDSILYDFHDENIRYVSDIIVQVSSDSLSLLTESGDILNLIPLAPTIAPLDSASLQEIFTGKSFEFTTTEEYLNFRAEFFPIKEPVWWDSLYRHHDVPNIFIPEFYDSYQSSSVWSAGIQAGSMLLRIEVVISSELDLGPLVITKVGANEIELMTWYYGQPIQYTAREIPTSKAISLNKLTRYAWRFKSEHVPPPPDTTALIYMGRVEDDFDQIDLEYVKDTTLLIHQQDLNDRSLTLQFHPDRTYSISRLNHQLDHGYWFPFVMNQFLVLKSAKRFTKSDGIYGGVIDIKELKKNRLKLKRKLTYQKDEIYHFDNSYLETYKPYRKR